MATINVSPEVNRSYVPGIDKPYDPNDSSTPAPTSPVQNVVAAEDVFIKTVGTEAGGPGGLAAHIMNAVWDGVKKAF